MKNSFLSELSWDTAFFGRKIGVLHVDYTQPDSITECLTQARKDGFSYLLCKVPSLNISVTKILEAEGFYLTDIAVIWLREMLDKPADYKFTLRARLATVHDIPMAREMAKSHFTHSRFYNDPFYSKEEADSLYQTWTENMIKGIAAHAVFVINDAGLIACSKLKATPEELTLSVSERNSSVKISAKSFCLQHSIGFILKAFQKSVSKLS